MRPYLFLVLALCAFCIPGAASDRRSKRTEAATLSKRITSSRSAGNVLVLLADDMGVDMVGSYGLGADLPPTPNIDGLASSGVRFRNAWSNPVCSPTRACLQTGRYSFRHGIGFVVSNTGIGLPMAEHIIPEMLDQGSTVGFTHAAFGKWHLGNQYTGGDNAPNMAGYSHFSGTLRSITMPETYFDWEHVVDGVATQETSYVTSVVVDDTIAWIASQTTPWFACVSFNLPHNPYHEPPSHLHTVDFTGVGTPEQEPRPYYKAMVEAMDTEIGRLLANIAPAVLNDTTIIFLGDNGTPKNVTVAPFLPTHAKSTVYEGGVNVPLIVSGPYVQSQGSTSDALVHAVDIYGTVADVAGVDYEAEYPSTTFDTISLLPYLANPSATSLRSVLYSEVFYPNGDGHPDPITFLCGTTGHSGGNVSPPIYVDIFSQRFIFQEDLGFQGPGTAILTISGQMLHETGSATLKISQAPANAQGFLTMGDSVSPGPFAGGLLLPTGDPWSLTTQITMNSNGVYTEEISHLPGLEFVYYQAAVVDVSLPAAWTITNAVKTRMTANNRAVRNLQYKLIYDPYTCHEQFYDLSVDPYEQNNLLQGFLTFDQRQNYNALWVELDAIPNS